MREKTEFSTPRDNYSLFVIPLSTIKPLTPNKDKMVAPEDRICQSQNIISSIRTGTVSGRMASTISASFSYILGNGIFRSPWSEDSEEPSRLEGKY